MTAYTLLWDSDNWNKQALLARSGTHRYIDYVGAFDRRPFKDIVAGDEIFILGVIGHNLYVGGRLIAASSPVSRTQAAAMLGYNDLVKKDLYVVAKRDQLDKFRSKHVDFDVAKNLELITSKGIVKKPDLENNPRRMISEQTFRPSYQLSPRSATILRDLLDLTKATASALISHNDQPDDSLDQRQPIVASYSRVNLGEQQRKNADTTMPLDESPANGKYEDRIRSLRTEVANASNQIEMEYTNRPGEDVDAIVKRRVGQGPFRSLLEAIYGISCCITGVANGRLLIASHIVPWSKSSPIQKTDPQNGLLLSVTWDALFDKGFVSFDNDGNLLCSAMLDEVTVHRLGISKNAKLQANMLTEERRKNLSWHRRNYGFET